MKNLILLLSIIFSVFYGYGQKMDTGDSIRAEAYAALAENRLQDAGKIFADNRQQLKTDALFALMQAELFIKSKQYEKIDFPENVTEAYPAKAYYLSARAAAFLNREKKSAEFLQKHLECRKHYLPHIINADTAFYELRNSETWIKLRKQKIYSVYEEQLSEAAYRINISDYSEAHRILDELKAKYKNRPEVFTLKADAHFAEGNFKTAEKYYSKALKIEDDNPEYIVKFADAAFKNGKFAKAAEHYEIFLQSEKHRVDIYKKKALCYLTDDQPEKAAKAISRYMNFYEKDAEAQQISGEAEYHSGNYLSALIQANENLKTNKTPEAFVLRGKIYLNSENYQDAFSDFSMALDINPENGKTWYLAGLALHKAGKDKQACSYLKKAIALKYYPASDLEFEICN